MNGRRSAAGSGGMYTPRGVPTEKMARRLVGHLLAGLVGGAIAFSVVVGISRDSEQESHRESSGELTATVLDDGYSSPMSPAPSYVWPTGTTVIREGEALGNPLPPGVHDGEATAFTVSLTSTFQERVTIIDWRLNIISRVDAPAGITTARDTLAVADAEGREARTLNVDLDSQQMSWGSVYAASPKAAPPTMFVDNDEGDTVYVVAATHKDMVSWQFTITYEVQGRAPARMTIRRPDGPFVTAATINSAVLSRKGCQEPVDRPLSKLCRGVRFESEGGADGEEVP